MALFTERLAHDMVAQVRRRYHELGAALGEPERAATDGTADEASPLYQDVTLLIDVANGRYERRDALVRQVNAALTRVLNALLGTALGVPARLPDDFWRSESGVLISRVRWWISVDDLISISNAAALAFGANTQATRMRIARAMEQGLLEWVPDPSVVNPQQNRRVLRSQVERLRDQRRLPDDADEAAPLP